MHKLLLTAVALVALAAPATRAQDNDPQAIIDRALQAQGGADKIKALKAYTAKAKGNINIMEMSVDFTSESFTHPPDKVKEILQLTVDGQQVAITQVFNGSKGWISVGGTVMEATKEQMDEFADAMHVGIVSNLVDIKGDKTIKLSLLGEAKVSDVAAVGVQVSKKDKKDVSLYFDKKTHLLIKAEYRGLDPVTKQDCAAEKIYSGYKEMLPGIKMPSKMRENIDGKRYVEVEITEIHAVDRHDDSVFNKPQ